MDEKTVAINGLIPLIEKWQSGYQEVSHTSDSIHNDSEWSWSDTDELVFFSSWLITILNNEQS